MTESEHHGPRASAGGAGSDAVDVLVVGAGPVGLTLAVDLLRRGVSVRVIDAADAPSATSRATSLTPRTLEVLDDLGAAEDLLASGVRITETEAYAAGRLAFRLRFPTGLNSTRYPFLLNNSQAETEAALTRALVRLGGQVERGVEWVGLAQDRTGVTAQVRTTGSRAGAAESPTASQIPCRWLVAADGGRSRIRKSMAIDFPGEVIPETVVLGDVMLDWDRPADKIYSWFNEDGALLAFPFTTPGLWRITAALTPDELEPYTKQAATDPLEALVGLYRRRTGDRRTTLSGLTWHSAFVANQRLAARYRAGRVLLAGDAGHVHTPAGGLGMNTGIQDAYNLGWKLALVATGGAAESLLDSYEAERRPVAEALLSSTGGLQKLYALRSPTAQAVRDAVLRNVLAIGPVRRTFFQRAGQLDLGYRSSPLSRTGPAARWRAPGAPSPGDRVPDAPLSRPDGTTTTLHDELRGVAPAVVILHDDAASIPAVADIERGATDHEVRLLHITRGSIEGLDTDERVLIDTNGTLYARLGIGTRRQRGPVVAVVRPDKHLSLLARQPTVDQLRAHLDQVAVRNSARHGQQVGSPEQEPRSAPSARPIRLPTVAR